MTFPDADRIPPGGHSRTSVEAGGARDESPDGTSAPPPPPPPALLDIEHLQVVDDPREWSPNKKLAILSVITFCTMNATLTTSIFYPAIESLKEDLRANDNEISATVSLFIFGQGLFPMCWSAFSELYGRKYSYLASTVIFIVGTTVISRVTESNGGIGLFLGMRVLQAMGSSSVLSLGAGTLADIYDVHERGTRMGIFYGIPLLGPSLGPIIGGALSERAGSWRNTFYFMIGYGGVALLGLIWLPETFRKERSLAWRRVYERSKFMALQENKQLAIGKQKEDPSSLGGGVKGAFSRLSRAASRKSEAGDVVEVKITFQDVNPFASIGACYRSFHNIFTIFFTGFLFAGQYCITYTTTLAFEAGPPWPWHYSPIEIGLVLLSFGAGNIVGSVVGGRYSDVVLNRIKNKAVVDTEAGIPDDSTVDDAEKSNNGPELSNAIQQAPATQFIPEMRIKSVLIPMVFIAPFFIAYGWVVEEKTRAYWPIIMLFGVGTFTIWIYAAILAYLVDSNPGKSSSAVAANSLVRGILAATASQAAKPIIDAIGYGAFYTILAGVLAVGEISLVFVMLKGQKWRARDAQKEAERSRKKQDKAAAKF